MNLSSAEQFSVIHSEVFAGATDKRSLFVRGSDYGRVSVWG